MTEHYLEMLEQGYYEISFALQGIEDHNVWKRPTENHPSIGEIVGHIAYWEAIRLAPAEEGQSQIQSLLIDPRFRYYPTILTTAPTDQHCSLTAEQIYDELQRIHKEVIAHFHTLNPDLDSMIPDGSQTFTYREYLKYASFHIAYHTGQIYTIRHFLGEETPDN
jgi:uncharacterized damage-inducible protein DinB